MIGDEGIHTAEPTPAQRRVAEHETGPMLVLGPAGSGRSEALALRLARLVSSGHPPERVLLLSRSRAARAHLRDRVDRLLAPAHAELWIATHHEIGERLLREYATEAGLDPFFAFVSAPDRLAILLDRVEELPLRRHEIRGNPAGLLARLLRRIDVLKAEAVSAGKLRDWATDLQSSADNPAQRERGQRELEFAELYVRHDRILRDAGNLDAGDLVLELIRLLRERPDVTQVVTERFEHVMADELEDAGVAHRRLLAALSPHGNIVCAGDPKQAVRRFRGAGAAALASFRAAHPDAAVVELEGHQRFGARIARAATAMLDPDAAPPAGAGAEDAGLVRFWRARGERAQAQAVAREVEHLLAAGEVRPESVCVIAGGGWREARLVAAALEERSVRFRYVGDAAFFQRPEVRDALAWLRMLADPGDAAAVVRVLTRPPVELRSADLAKVTTIARRRKLDMVSALDAALESPQLPPEARDRIQAFLKLHRAAASAMEQMRADVFVRRLIERVGLRRHRLFAASPETAERLVNLSRLAELAAEWARREPRGSVRDFVRHLTAVAEAGELGAEDCEPPKRGAVQLAAPEQVKGLSFDRVYLLGLDHGALATRPWEDSWIPAELSDDEVPAAGDELTAARTRMLAHTAATRARRALVLSWAESGDEAQVGPSVVYEAAIRALDGDEEVHEEELFGPAEGLHSTYRMIRDEVLEASWRAGSALSEMRLDTAEDVNRAVARFLELVKLAALIQRPGGEPAHDALAAINELLGRVATPEQAAALAESALDAYVTGEEREREARRELVAARREPSLEQFLPRRGEGLALSASDIDLYRTCPLKYKFARVFAIPQEPTINQRFGILIHQVLERFHSEELRADSSGAQPALGARAGSLDRLLTLFEAGWRRAGFGSSDDELQYRDRAVAALARYRERHVRSETSPVWLERSFSFAIGPHQLRGRIDRVDRLPEGGYELIDYKTGQAKAEPELTDDVQLALYRLGAREAWRIDADLGSYWYVLDDERVHVAAAADDAERVERTVLEAAAGISGQDFEPRPSYEICSWCDYRLICPASEA
ncbi:MAG TPA: ATP-dependent DNA helicase [Solirubrobacterales bacterium]|nr:ATP-dependent DNA helicase [Solirubrobacterales bacterium]